MKRTWKKLFAFVCAFTLVAAPVTYNAVNADAPGSNSNGVQIGNVSIGNNSTTSSNNASVGTDYTLTIPATLNVANAGWNATDGITAKVKSGDTFDTGKKLTVTAASTNNWALKSGANSIGYNLAAATGTYSSTAEAASWEFSADELNAESGAGTKKDMGIIVDDYSSKPAGNYSDTVTFTASVVVQVQGVPLSESSVGMIVGTDGLAYDAAFKNILPTGVTAVARICYVDGSGHGLALAMADANGSNRIDWNTATTSATTQTPAITGGTWKLASKSDWEKMIATAGNNAVTIRDSFSSVGGTNMQSATYWTSTDYENNSNSAYRVSTYSANEFFTSPKTLVNFYARACLEF